MPPLPALPTARRAVRRLANRGQCCHAGFEDPTASDNALPQAWSYGFDAVNRATTVTDPLNHTTTTAYWADGRVHTVTDAIGNVTNTAYDFVNKDIATTAAYGTSLAATTTQYLDAAGNVTSVQDPLGHTTTNMLNAVYDLTAVTDPLNHTTSNTLNPNGIPTASTDALNHSTNYTLNALGETVATTDATSRTTNTVLDANGQTVATIDSGGNTGLAVFNGAGANNISIDADGNQTRKQFDAAGRVVSFTDPDGNTTMWAYDRNGNKIEQWDPTGGTVTWAYNAVNQVTGRTDELGQSETFAYDNARRLTTELWKNSSGTTVNTITYGYDADNRATSVGDINGTYAYTFDALGRMTHQTDIWNISMTLGYDLANRLTSVTDSLGGTVANTYDNANRITEKQFTDTSSHALSVGYAYDNADRLTTLSRYSDANETTLIGKTTYGFDNANRLTSITHANASGTTIDSYNYTYNTAGLVGSVSSTLGPSATYTYDPAGQLLSDGTTTYSFDANGNRNSSGYSTNTGNQLATDGTWNYSYNAAGNLIQKTNIGTAEVWLYTYNNVNQLTLAQHKPSSTGSVDKSVAYTYDVLNNLIETVVDPDGTGQHDVTTKYAYDPNANVWADLNSSAQLTARRIFGAQQDSLIARIDSNGVGWYLTDMLGSVRDDISSTGTLLNHEDFNAWGKLTYQSGASYADRMAFTGRPLDTITGLQNNRNRWYDPATSRWMSQDPLGFGAGDSNLYRYISNNPSGGVDPAEKKRGRSSFILTPWTAPCRLDAMPRRARVAPGGFVYHVLNRTVARHALFNKDEDYAAFERVLDQALEEHPMRVLAYCLMPNHWHFVLWPQKDGQLTAFMRWLTHTHTMRWHAHYHTSGSGHLYQGRFKSFPIAADDHLYQVLRYVERNALRANLVAQAEAWRWSSLYLRTMDPERAAAWLTDWPVPIPPDWWQRVQEPQTEAELDRIRRAVLRGCPYGALPWQLRTARRLGLEATLRPVGRPRKKGSSGPPQAPADATRPG